MDNWLPIESAKKAHGARILVPVQDWPHPRVYIAVWNTQACHAHPKPYWEYVGRNSGVRWDRENQPKFWQPIPEIDATIAEELKVPKLK